MDEYAECFYWRPKRGAWRSFYVAGGLEGHFAGLMAALHPHPPYTLPREILFFDYNLCFYFDKTSSFKIRHCKMCTQGFTRIVRFVNISHFKIVFLIKIHYTFIRFKLFLF